MIEYSFEKSGIFPNHIQSERINYIPIHEYGVSVRECYNKFSELDPQTTKYVSFDSHESVTESKEYMDRVEEEYKSGEQASYLMELRQTGDWIGTGTLDITWDRKIAESGIYLFEEYWGNGYGTERGETMVEVAFGEYDIEKWVSRCAVDNVASKKSIEKYVVQNGGEKYGRIPNMKVGETVYDLFVYVIDESEYNGG